MRQVILFGLDGATYTVLDDLVARGIMPCLGRVMQCGVRATLRSTVPPLTPIAWTSMVTGRSPGHHGIIGFIQNASPESDLVRVVSYRNMRAETLWSMVNRHGLRAGSLNFVAHNPAPAIDGYVIPGWTSWRWLRRYSHPAGLIEGLKAGLPGFDIKALAMDFNEEKKAVAGVAIEDYEGWVSLHSRREQQWIEVLLHQLRHDPCELVGVVFDGVDKLQHLLWKFLDPGIEPESPDEEFLRVRDLCWNYFRLVDGALERTIAAAGSEATVLIVSDHGFRATSDIFYVNTWLEQQGYLCWKEGLEVTPDESMELGVAVPYNLTAFDMSRTRAYASAASSNGIHIRAREGEDPQALRRELTEALLSRCPHPETGRPLVTRVWPREEIFPGPHMAMAPDLTLTLHDHGFFSVFRGDKIVKKRPVPFGTHHPDGILIGYGAGIRQGMAAGSLSILDVAPTVLHALGLPVPENLEGRVAQELFARAERVRLEERSGAEPAFTAAAPPLDEPEDDAQIIERLKALGYIE